MQAWSKTMAAGVAGMTVVGASAAEAATTETVLTTGFRLDASSSGGPDNVRFNVEGFSGDGELTGVIVQLSGSEFSGQLGFPTTASATMLDNMGFNEGFFFEQIDAQTFNDGVSFDIDLTELGNPFDEFDFTNDFIIDLRLSTRSSSEPITTTWSAGPSALTVSFESVAAVPIPATLPLLLAGVVGIAGLRLSQRKS